MTSVMKKKAVLAASSNNWEAFVKGGALYKEGRSPYILSVAARHGHLDTVIAILNEWRFVNKVWAMDMAAVMGHFKVMEYMHIAYGGFCSREAIDRVAENGHLDIIKYMKQHFDVDCTYRTVDRALLKGHYDVVEYLRCEFGVKWSCHAIYNARCEGLDDVVRYIESNS